MSKLTSINKLPTIIDSVGLYRTRSGAVVMIHKIATSNNPNTTSYDAKGSILTKPNGKRLKSPVYEIWHTSGRCYVLNESGRDIVGKLD